MRHENEEGQHKNKIKKINIDTTTKQFVSVCNVRSCLLLTA